MSENTEQAEQGWARFVAWMVVLLAIYVLSIGPVAWLCVTFNAPDAILAAVNAVYLPIAWICSLSDWSTALYVRYLGLWVEVGP